MTDTATATRRVRARGTSTASRPGRLSLRVLGLDDGQEVCDLARGATLTFGRSSTLSDVALPFDSISKRHFSLRVTRDGVELEDLASKNGTWYADRRVRRMLLCAGDRFCAGSVEIELVGVDDVEVEVSSDERCGHLLGRSVAMREVFRRLEVLGPSDLDVLIEGDTGTGKELTARTLHDLSNRAGPFVVLDCAALGSLADGTLFGHRQGAFTGAVRDQAGVFEAADGGTLFIDELGELPAELQLRLLRFLDQRAVSRLGEPGISRRVDVRVVAATNRRLDDEVRDGRFRQDLLMRAARSRVFLPSLRERGDDVLFLADVFLQRLAKHGEPARLSSEANVALLAYDWPGNVRELRSVLEEAVVFCKDGEIGPMDLTLGQTGWAARLAAVSVDSLGLDELHDVVDRVVLQRAFERHHSRSGVARALKISRARLRRMLKSLGLEDGQDTDDDTEENG